MRWADVYVCMLADGVALRNRCPQGQADPRAAMAGGASGVTMVRAGPHPRRARSMRWADVYTGRDRRRRVGRDDGSGRPAPSARQVDAMGRRLRSPRLPGVDVPGVDGDGPTSTSPAWARRLRPGPAGPCTRASLFQLRENMAHAYVSHNRRRVRRSPGFETVLLDDLVPVVWRGDVQRSLAFSRARFLTSRSH